MLQVLCDYSRYTNKNLGEWMKPDAGMWHFASCLHFFCGDFCGVCSSWLKVRTLLTSVPSLIPRS